MTGGFVITEAWKGERGEGGTTRYLECSSLKKWRIQEYFCATASKRTFSLTMLFGVCGGGIRAWVSLVVLINRIYLHHNLERLIHAPTFLLSSVCEIRGRKPGLVNGYTLSRSEVRGRLHFNPHVLSYGASRRFVREQLSYLGMLSMFI